MKQPSRSRASYSLLSLKRGWNDDRSIQHGQARVENTMAVKYETNSWVPHTTLSQCLLWSYPKAQHAQVVLAEGYISKRCMHGRWLYKYLKPLPSQPVRSGEPVSRRLLAGGLFLSEWSLFETVIEGLSLFLNVQYLFLDGWSYSKKSILFLNPSFLSLYPPPDFLNHWSLLKLCHDDVIHDEFSRIANIHQIYTQIDTKGVNKKWLVYQW